MSHKSKIHGLIDIILAILVVVLIFYPGEIGSDARFYVGAALVMLILFNKHLRGRLGAKKNHPDENEEE